VVFNTGPYTVLPENSILITAGFPSSHQLKSYVAYKCRLKLAARAVLSADAGLLVRPTGPHSARTEENAKEVFKSSCSLPLTLFCRLSGKVTENTFCPQRKQSQWHTAGTFEAEA